MRTFRKFMLFYLFKHVNKLYLLRITNSSITPMKQDNFSLQKVAPMLMAYMVMGFVDIVGVATGYIKQDFELSDVWAQTIPSLAFVWFFLMSIPSGILQDRFGKKRMLNMGIALTAVGMLIPFAFYSLFTVAISIILLGVGNTIIQVSSNPLLRDVISSEKRFASMMSLSQFIKAIVSLLGPILATFAAASFGSWRLVFLVYGVTSIVAYLWLAATTIEESRSTEVRATFASCLGLLKNPFVLGMTMAIFLIVGADVGMNSNIAAILSSRYGIGLEEASLAISIYFTALMIGRFSGALLLSRIPLRKFLLASSVLAIAAVVFFMVAPTVNLARAAIFLVGLGSANLFPLIFTAAINRMPDRSNEISALMVMAISGGALIPPIMGAVSGAFGVAASAVVILICLLYVLFAALSTKLK